MVNQKIFKEFKLVRRLFTGIFFFFRIKEAIVEKFKKIMEKKCVINEN